MIKNRNRKQLSREDTTRVIKEFKYFVRRKKWNSVHKRPDGLSAVVGKKIRLMKKKEALALAKLDMLNSERTEEIKELAAVRQKLLCSMLALKSLQDFKCKISMPDEREEGLMRAKTLFMSTTLPDQLDLQIALKRGEDLETKKVVLVHERDKLSLSNAIMGEFLKGYVESKTRSEKSDEILTQINRYNQGLAYCTEIPVSSPLSIEDCASKVFSLLSYFKEVEEKITKISGGFKSSRSKIERKIKKAREKTFELSENCNSLEQKMAYLNEQLEVGNDNLAKLYLQRGIASAEQTCAKCYTVYQDRGDCSCISHASQWNGKFYFCCDSKKKTAPGCIHSVHSSLEYENIKHRVKRFKKLTCSSCKKKGHSIYECPKDPNVRNIDNQAKEFARIGLLRQKTKKLVVNSNFEDSFEEDNNHDDNNFN